MSTHALDALVAKYDLNLHPFYSAWRAGTLPRSALASYAVEYAPFIAAIAEGWATLGDDDHAGEERAHSRLWNEFRDALGAKGDPSCDEARALLDEVKGAFATKATALGALYAFEAQQPSTTRSKLDGLREHYGITGEAARYFALHSADYGERDMLRERAAALSPVERESAEQACERTCQAMWTALSGILAAQSDYKPGSC
jgi:pyrroloquinoline-quinone synthase